MSIRSTVPVESLISFDVLSGDNVNFVYLKTFCYICRIQSFSHLDVWVDGVWCGYTCSQTLLSKGDTWKSFAVQILHQMRGQLWNWMETETVRFPVRPVVTRVVGWHHAWKPSPEKVKNSWIFFTTIKWRWIKRNSLWPRELTQKDASLPSQLNFSLEVLAFVSGHPFFHRLNCSPNIVLGLQFL
jgi:hypothetical protein